MAYKNVWWHSTLEFGAGLNPPQTWPNVMEQYRRPTDLRYRDIPREPYSPMLYYAHPHMGMPVYRGTFRDKPHTVTDYYPSGVENKPVGYFGRQYYEHGPPQFKYNGPVKDSLYWLEKPRLQPVVPRPITSQGSLDNQRGVNDTATSLDHPSKLHLRNAMSRSSSDSSRYQLQGSSCAYNRTTQSMMAASGGVDAQLSVSDRLGTYKSPGLVTNRITIDGVGYL